MKIFKRIYIEITSKCNLNCSFCPIHEREPQTMNKDSFERVLEQVAPLTNEISLHLMGEPLAHHDFPLILQTCSRFQTPVQLTTNGLMLKKFTREIINSSCIRQVNISAQSFMDNFPSAKLKKYLENLFEFIQATRQHREDIFLNIRLWNHNSLNGPKQNEEIFSFLERKLEITINRNIEVGAIKSKKIAEKIYLHFDSRFTWPRLSAPFQSETGRCHGAIDQIAIHADGTVVPCCLDDQKIINLGNIFEKGIKDILQSTRYLNINNGFLNGKRTEKLCQHCSYVNRFKKKNKDGTP